MLQRGSSVETMIRLILGRPRRIMDICCNMSVTYSPIARGELTRAGNTSRLRIHLDVELLPLFDHSDAAFLMLWQAALATIIDMKVLPFVDMDHMIPAGPA
jgi:hypothetical protein